MNELNFCYWLQGYCELNGEAPTMEQWEDIKNHLKLVFEKKTPDIPKISLEDVTIRNKDFKMPLVTY